MKAFEAIDMTIDLAVSEIDYHEKESNSQLDDKTANAGDENYTKYSRDLDKTKMYNGPKQGYPWCDQWHDWLHYVLWGEEMAMQVLCQPKRSCGAGCKYSADYYKAAGRFHKGNPRRGDQIFFANGEDVYHTGIVENVVENEVHTIEGNTSDRVARRVYNINDKRIYGYGTPRWELLENFEKKKEDEQKTAGHGQTKKTNEYSPIICMMTQSTCYRGTSKMNPVGVLWHSTGANNPWLRRYVQPDDNASDRGEMLELLGTNPYNNDWNHKTVDAGLNAWVGKLSDGTVAAVQTMPWDYKPWGCGSGSNGSCNNGWIQFEICEDSLGDQTYFNAVYEEAVKLTAYLCKQYNIDPNGAVGNVPTILCHQDSYRLGMGSNHADVYHWFKRYGKTMDDVRKDVAAILGSQKPIYVVYAYGDREISRGMKGPDVEELQHNLIELGYDLPKYGADGDFGGETDAAVRKLQAANNLVVDGEVGNATYKKIEELLKKKRHGVSTIPSEVPAEKAIWNRLYSYIGNNFGVAGVMGNFKVESNFRSNNVENSYESKLGMDDEEYTRAVDNGSYDNFIYDRAGYGLYQATFWSIKQHLLDFAKKKGVSIGDRDMQVDAFVDLMKQNYPTVWQTLVNARSVAEASNAVLLKFERPKDQSESAQKRRASIGEGIYAKYAGGENGCNQTLRAGSIGEAVVSLQNKLISLGYKLPKYGADGDFGDETKQAVMKFQMDHGLEVDGIAGPMTYAALERK